MTNPTTYPELNAVLAGLVGEAQAILAKDFCGAYLQGSFAVGDADDHSDVDFIIVTATELTAEQLNQLQAMHGRFKALDVPWAKHLEGSYFPKDLLRDVDPERTELYFLDNGAAELELDNHCNTAVVRWILRERSVILAGPDPKELVAPVDAADLRAEGLAALREYAEWAPAPTKAGGMSEWKQVYLVLSFCRILRMLETGEVVSKKQGGEWALGALDAEWSSLIQRSLDDRADPWGRVSRPADPEIAERTIAFADYVVILAARLESG